MVQEISAILSAKRMKLLEETGGKPSKEQIWAMYKEVYKGKPNWLKAIESYFQ